MLGTIIGGIIIGGVASNIIERKREKRFEAECRENFRRMISDVSKSSSTSESKDVDQKYERQIEFFDDFRRLDNRLARGVNKGYKGVTYLVKGMEVTRFSDRGLIYALKNIRNFRNKLSHDKRRWCEVEAPSASIMADLRRAENWVNSNYSYASTLTYKGFKAFTGGNSRPNGSYNRHQGQNGGHGGYHGNNSRPNQGRPRQGGGHKYY